MNVFHLNVAEELKRIASYFKGNVRAVLLALVVFVVE